MRESRELGEGIKEDKSSTEESKYIDNLSLIGSVSLEDLKNFAQTKIVPSEREEFESLSVHERRILVAMAGLSDEELKILIADSKRNKGHLTGFHYVVHNLQQLHSLTGESRYLEVLK